MICHKADGYTKTTETRTSQAVENKSRSILSWPQIVVSTGHVILII